ncbi:MAG: putative glycolipid-binding domain-containing protein, partial [Solirubrobacterales bacterium]|nr:putative glycolipid-binding domain-containing protein [Solirubrobacterales bacterium]
GDFMMAFIRMPTLRVEASPQRYEHVRVRDDGSVVRYLSRDADFTAELELDRDGLLRFYPRLARRVEPHDRAGERG